MNGLGVGRAVLIVLFVAVGLDLFTEPQRARQESGATPSKRFVEELVKLPI